MSNHTPGEWLREGVTVYALDWDGVTMTGKGADYRKLLTNRFTCAVLRGKRATIDECEANARLIAAAPDLLSACKAMLAHERIVSAGNGLGLPHQFRQAEAAIAKAEGRS